MLILGDLSGIQGYLLDVAHEGGGQARRLRARSFFLQLIAECVALAVRRAAAWPAEGLIFSSAGKFALSGPTLAEEQRGQVLATVQRFEEWLLDEAGGQLRFSLGLADEPGNKRSEYLAAQRALALDKAQPWRRVVLDGGGWKTGRLVLRPLDTPCAICRRRSATVEEQDDEQTRWVCQRCHADLDVGRRLPRQNWLLIHESGEPADLEIVDLRISFYQDYPLFRPDDVIAASSLRKDQSTPPSLPPAKTLARPLARHVPVNDHGQPVDFETLAARSSGDSLLGVLKMDVDSLGMAMQKVLTEEGLERYGVLASELDRFFAESLDAELSQSRWNDVYTVFAGGDDLLVVAPWSLALEYAGHVAELFSKEFSTRGLTISAGLSFSHPRRPIRSAVEQAEALLRAAKAAPAADAGPRKGRISALGQTWEWREHSTILQSAKRVASWVGEGKAERGWLQTLLKLAELRAGAAAPGGREPALATSRLAYHVARNYPRGSEIRTWGLQLVQNFDTRDRLDTRFLPAIARYAIAATRRRED